MNKRNVRSNMRLVVALTLVWGTLLTHLPQTRVLAQATNYASAKRQINAGVLVSNASLTRIAGGVGPQNVNPHFFYVLEKRIDVKPGGWDFVNPLAPSQITSGMVQRWRLRAPNDPAFTAGTPEALIFRDGASLTKNIGAYWEVNLDTTTDADLRTFDVLLMAVRNNTLSFTPSERRRIQGFVDAGGTLILEDEGGSDVNANAPFITPLTFNGPVSQTYRAVPSARFHPLLTAPYSLAEIDIREIGAYSYAGRRPHRANAAVPLNPRIYSPILRVRGLPNSAYISAGDYGAGHVVISSAGIATGVSAFVGGSSLGEGNNDGVVSGENMLKVVINDLKLAYNIVAWASAAPTEASNSRRTASSNEQIGSSIARKWSSIPNSAAGIGSGAIVYKGGVFFVDSRSILHAFKANPGQRMDRNGLNSDSGIPDFYLGAPYDEIWNIQLTGGVRYSTPTAYSVYNQGASRVVDVVMVTAATGITYAYEAFPRDANFRLQSTTNLLWQFGAGGGSVEGSLLGTLSPLPVPAPAVSEGVVFTYTRNTSGDANHPWRIVALNPITGANLFQSANAMAPSPRNDLGGNVAGLPDIIGSLAVGYVRDRASGALDKMIYAPTVAYSNERTGNVCGIWFGTKGEPLQATPGDDSATRFRPQGERRRVPWYLGNVTELRPTLTRVTRDSLGNVIATVVLTDGTDYSMNYNGTGGNHAMEVLLTSPLPINSELVADYTLNWPGFAINAVNMTAPDMSRFTTARRFNLPSVGQDPIATFTNGSAGIGSDDSLVFTTNWAGNVQPGRIFSLREQYDTGAGQTGGARGGDRGSGAEVAWMFSPHTGGNFGGINLLPRLVNHDTFRNQVPDNSFFISQFVPVGSPAILNHVAYVVANGVLSSGNASNTIPVTVVLAMRANPTMSFSIGRAIPNNVVQVRVRQVDLFQSTAAETRYIELIEGRNFTVDRDTGNITITDCRQPRADAINTSLPIQVLLSTPGAANTDQIDIVNRQTGLGPLDNVLWYTIIPQNGLVSDTKLQNAIPASGPTVIGDTLYFGTTDGHVASLELRGGTGGTQVPIFSSGSYRFTKTPVLAGNDGSPLNIPIIHPPVGGANVLAVGASQGIAALEQQLTLIADNNRLLLVDPAGNAVWSLDGTRTVAPTRATNAQTAVIRTPLSRPNVVRQTGQNTFLVADSGNHRIIQTDKSGYVSYELRSVQNGLQMLRPGDPLSLNTPTDVHNYTEGTGAPDGAISITNPRTGVTYTYTGPYTAVHYIVADSGNYRVVEVVDAFMPNGVPVPLTGSDGSTVLMQKQVIFVTRSLAEQGANYRYRSVQLFVDPTSATNDNYLITAVDNLKVSNGDQGVLNIGQGGSATLGGAIVAMRRYTADPSKEGEIAVIITSVSFTDGTGAIVRQQPIANPVWFKEFDLRTPNGPSTRYLLVDDNGCYMLRPQGNDAVVEWALTSEDYYFMTGRRLRASSIQKLNLADYHAPTNSFYPRFLITNRYVGDDNVPDVFGFTDLLRYRGQVKGEVFEIRSLDFAVSGGYRNGAARLYRTATGTEGVYLVRNETSAITWMFPKEIMPVDNATGKATAGAIQRVVGNTSDATSTYILEQPTYSERPF